MADEESEKIVQMYEEMFSNRYTEEDEEYRQVKATPIPPPPCVVGYFTRSKRNFDGNRGGRGRGHWGNRGGGNWHRNRHQHDGGRHDRQDDYRGHSGRDYNRHSDRGDRNRPY